MNDYYCELRAERVVVVSPVAKFERGPHPSHPPRLLKKFAMMVDRQTQQWYLADRRNTWQRIGDVEEEGVVVVVVVAVWRRVAAGTTRAESTCRHL